MLTVDRNIKFTLSNRKQKISTLISAHKHTQTHNDCLLPEFEIAIQNVKVWFPGVDNAKTNPATFSYANYCESVCCSCTKIYQFRQEPNRVVMILCPVQRELQGMQASKTQTLKRKSKKC